jgi:flagellar hook assembly protein FlgD
VTATNSAGSTTAASSNSLAIPVPPAPALTGLGMNPNPVKSSGTASVSLSAPATVTVVVRDASGNLVRTLVSATSEPAGTVSATWNRTNSSGQRVKSGTYALAVSAADASGRTVSATTTFKAS